MNSRRFIALIPNPRITRGASAALSECCNHVEQIAGRTCQTVQSGDDEHVAAFDFVEQLGQLARSVFAPDTFSLNTLAQSAADSSASRRGLSCAVSQGPTVSPVVWLKDHRQSHH
jgi:hypothetical protein